MEGPVQPRVPYHVMRCWASFLLLLSGAFPSSLAFLAFQPLGAVSAQAEAAAIATHAAPAPHPRDALAEAAPPAAATPGREAPAAAAGEEKGVAAAAATSTGAVNKTSDEAETASSSQVEESREAASPPFQGTLPSPGNSSEAPSAKAKALPPPPALKWTKCTQLKKRKTSLPVLCARATVPLDYSDITGDVIQLAVIKHAATGPGKRLGSIFYNPGGPGGSGVDSLPGLLLDFPEALLQRFDLVSWDPRGVGASTNVTCFRSSKEEGSFLEGLPPKFPVSEAEEDALVQGYADLGVRCLERSGKLLSHVSTAETARDLDLLQQAVGDLVLHYWGVSYGATLGAVYANMFPENVGALVLDAPASPVAWTNGGNDTASTMLSLRTQQHLGFNQTAEAFFRLCGKSWTDGCPFSALSSESTAKRFTSLLESLRHRPVSSKGQVTLHWRKLLFEFEHFIPAVHEWDWLASFLESVRLREQEVYPVLAGRLSKATSMLLKWMFGDQLAAEPKASSPATELPSLPRTCPQRNSWFVSKKDCLCPARNETSNVEARPSLTSRVLKAVLAFLAGLFEEPGPEPRAPRYGDGMLAWLAITCAEVPVPRDPWAYQELATFMVQQSGVFGFSSAYNEFACAFWPVKAAERYLGPWNKTTANAILVTSTTTDPSTPYSNAVELSQVLQNATLLTVDGYGHGVLDHGSKCAYSLVVDYFLHGKVPGKGTRCSQEFKAFKDKGTKQSTWYY